MSAVDIIKGRVPKERLAGRLFVIGTTAAGLLDIRATPISRRMPGVEIQANILETIFSEGFFRSKFATFITQKRITQFGLPAS